LITPLIARLEFRRNALALSELRKLHPFTERR
jgi:hypothetical protein